MLTDLMSHPALALRFLLKRVKEIPSKGLPRLRRRGDDDFDRKYGVETAKEVQIVPTDSPNFSHGSRYSAASEAAIRWCIESCAMLHEETTFVDIGAGKGRALIVAARYPFKKIVGVEYSAKLAAICDSNLRKLNLEARCEVIVADAADFQFSSGNLLAFLYNPFDAIVLDRVLRNLASAQGRVQIAQLGPGHDAILNSGLARVVCHGDGPTLYEMVRTPNGESSPAQKNQCIA